MFHDRIAEAKFASLQKEFGFEVCIETGTHLGYGALHASQYCRSVITIESNHDFRFRAMHGWLREGWSPLTMYPECCWCFQNRALITSYHGNSPTILQKLLAEEWRDELVCFYLDAHWEEVWPLQAELAVIAAQHPNCLIIIHDFKVPGKNFNFDSYGGQDLDYDYVKDALAKINPNFKIFYNEECDPKDEPYSSARGILYATP